jgi:hypothetical protein
MALTAAQQRATALRFTALHCNHTSPAHWTKAQLETAVAVTDQWLTDNQAAYITALNAGATAFGGANSTATQKALLFVYTVLVRQGLL